MTTHGDGVEMKEEVLIRHPRLRLSVMHYGSPLIDEMIAMLGAYPSYTSTSSGSTPGILL